MTFRFYRFMLQDVIALRRRKWVTKTVVDLQPRMMDQIQKEAEQQHRQTEVDTLLILYYTIFEWGTKLKVKL